MKYVGITATIIMLILGSTITLSATGVEHHISVCRYVDLTPHVKVWSAYDHAFITVWCD